MTSNNSWDNNDFPEPIKLWLNTIATTGKGQAYVDRAQRLANYADASFENAETLRKAWRALENAINQEPSDALICIFMLLPDKPDRAPFSAIYGKRSIDPGEEKARYDALLGHVIAIQEFMNPPRPAFQNMLMDSTATPEAHIACFDFREVESSLLDGLKKLRTLLEVIDPKAKIPTDHWDSENADVKNYVILVAALNRYLSTPQHKALAVLANANCPSESVTSDQLRMSWNRGANERA